MSCTCVLVCSRSVLYNCSSLVSRLYIFPFNFLRTAFCFQFFPLLQVPHGKPAEYKPMYAGYTSIVSFTLLFFFTWAWGNLSENFKKGTMFNSCIWKPLKGTLVLSGRSPLRWSTSTGYISCSYMQSVFQWGPGYPKFVNRSVHADVCWNHIADDLRRKKWYSSQSIFDIPEGWVCLFNILSSPENEMHWSTFLLWRRNGDLKNEACTQLF